MIKGEIVNQGGKWKNWKWKVQIGGHKDDQGQL